MKRVEANGAWSLFWPNEALGLHEVHGEEFVAQYEKYEKESRQRKTIPARKLWNAILEGQIETGGPFVLCKDSANGTNKLLMIICTHEFIVSPEKPQYYQVIQPLHVGNLTSIALPTFISNGKCNPAKLHDVTKVVAYILNCIINVNYYPIPEAQRSSIRHRPIGICVQGLVDTFMAFRMPFDSPAAIRLAGCYANGSLGFEVPERECSAYGSEELVVLHADAAA
jgi:ribonucleoside-diphosphate reductase subunit M1